MSDADRLSEIRARLNAATAGEWHVLRPGDEVLVAGTEANIAFLLAELSRLSTVIEDAASVQHAESRERRHREIDLVVEMLTKHDLAQATQYPAYRGGNRHETAECIWYLLNPEPLVDSAPSVPVSPKEKN